MDMPNELGDSGVSKLKVQGSCIFEKKRFGCHVSASLL